MVKNSIAIIILALVCASCATTGKGKQAQPQQLQDQISYLEAELDRKSREIENLELGLERQRAKQHSLRQESTVTRMSVRQIQTALKSAGFYKGAVDGKQGPQTREAIRNFQRANGLKVDGIAGRRTIAQLSKYLN